MAKTKITYQVKKSGGLPKSLKGQTFKTYEQARSEVRRYIRSRKDYVYMGTNPAITDYGFSISKA